MTKLAICLPSRGLIHSRTAEALLNALQDTSAKVFVSHNQPIPECFNVTCQAALDAGCTQIMIVEEDIVITPDTIEQLRAGLLDHDIAFCNYSLGNYDANREMNGVYYLATGCIMFRREALEQLMPFEAKYNVSPKSHSIVDTVSDEVMHTKFYGMHDGYMSLRIHELGLTYTEVGHVDHWHVQEYGRHMVNDGRHQLVRLGDG